MGQMILAPFRKRNSFNTFRKDVKFGTDWVTILVIVGCDEVLADQGCDILVTVGCDEVLADQGTAILVIFGCDEVLADQGSDILVIVGCD